MTKKVFLFVPISLIIMGALLVAAFFAASPGADRTAFAANFPEDQIGDGTPENPYIIADYTDLISLSSLIADEQDAHYATAHYSVSADIIYADEMDFLPIGSEEKPFNGVFLGNGVIISGLCVNMNAGSDYGGFFGYIGEEGKVSGVGLYKASVGSSDCFGGIAGYNAGRISECFVDGTVSGLDRVGGIAGENAGTGEIENCFSSADIRPASGSVPLSNAGGIAGSNAGSIRYSYTISAVEAASDSDSVGGAAGANDGSFTKAYALSITAGGLKAVGEGSAAGVNLLTGYNLQEYALSSMFSDATAARWKRVEKYSTGDGASFSGPVQAVFREKASDVTEFDGILFDVFSYRYFSVADVARYDDWGTAENPYLISSAEELKDLALLVSARNVEMTGLSAQSYRGKYFALSEDIEIENADSVLPVGSGSTPFSGNFSGRGHKIEGFKINSTDEYTGLFGYLSYASVSDLYIENASVTGTGAAGIAAGRAVSSTLKNIVITASLLTASSNSGAIVAVSDNSGGTQGAIESVYVEATLAARNSSSGTPYADVGVINGSAPSSDGNIWYAGKTVASSRLQATSTVVMREPGADAVLSVDGSEGSYRFTLTAKPNAGTSVEYRDADETIIADNADVISLDSLRDSGSQYGTKVFYLRFVRTVSIDVEPRNGGTKVISALFLIKGERVTEASLYEGQSATIVIEDLRTEANNNIYYIYDIETKGSDIGLKLTNQTGAATMPTVVGEFTMDDSLDAITVVQSFASTGTDYINFLTNEYDGKKVEYDNTKLIISYSGGSAETRVEFSSGSAPTDVGEYLVTTDFYGKGGIFENILLGSIRSTLVVNPREITYDPADDINVNPERTPTVAWGDSGIITLEIPVEDNKGIGEGQFIEGDVLGISATVTFDAAALQVPGDNKSVSYTLSLVGEDAKNYKLTAESVQNEGLGKVEKRKIIITFESTSKVYDGQPFEINSFKVTNALESAGAIEHSHLSIKIKPEGTVIEAGDVGEYEVKVQWADATPEVGNGLSFEDVYDIYIEDGKYSLKYVPGSEGIICSVLPKKLDVEYLLTNGETSYEEGYDPVYNGTEFTPSAASFTAASGGSTDSLEGYIKIYRVNGSTEEASGNPCNAGNYILKIDAAALAEEDIVYRNYIFEEYAFEIKKAVPTAKVNSENKYYYSPENVTVTFADAVVIEYPGEESLEVVYVYDGKEAESHSFTAAGNYEITVKITGDGNRESVEVKLSITVNKRPVTLSVAKIEAEYGDPIEYLDNIIVTDGLDDNMEIAFSSLGITVTAKNSSGQDIPDVGTYDILLSTENVNSSNYDVKLTTVNEGALRVIQKKLYISWEEGLFSEYGQEISVPYTASYEDGTVPESPPLVGELQIGKWETDSNNTDEEIFVPASVNVYGRYDADTYDIGWTEEFEEKNKNYLIIKNGTYAYRIKKAVFGIYVQSNQKNFGEDDPEVTWGLINVFDEEADNVKNAYQVAVTRRSGENAYISEDGVISSPAVYAYSVKVELNGKEPDNYEHKPSLNELGSLSILRIAPVVKVSGNAVEPNTVLDGSVPVNAVAYDLNGSAMAGIFSWATEEGFAPDFIGSASVTVKAKFTPDYGVPENGNYSETEFDVILTVIPAEVAITWGVIRYVYSGETTPEMHYTAVAAGESVTLLLTYSGDRINVGTYTVTASIRDPRFILPANSSVEVEIVPATVTVSFSSPSYEIIAGEQLTPEVVYSGFVGGETAEVLTREAEFTMYSEPGNYKLSLSGAEADNYEFEYVDSDLIIYRAELEDEEAGAKFEGAFPEEVGLTITVADDLNAGNALNEFNLIKGAYKSLSGKVLNTVYSLNYSGLDGYVNNGELTVTMPAFSAESADSVKYLYITNSGEIVVIDDVGYNEDGTVTFTLEDAAYILVSVDDESLFGSMTMYVAIGGVVLAVIILIAVVTAVKRRRKRRIIKFDD